MSSVIALLLLASCARTSVSHLGSESGGLPKPDVIVVQDFSVSPDQVALDHTIGLRLQELVGSTSDAAERMRLAQQIAGTVTKNLIEDLRKQGFNAVPAAQAPASGTRMLSIQGQFFSIDQGSQRQRMIVGFGMGASQVRVLVQAFANAKLVDDFYVTVESSRRPGVGPMAGAGAVAGGAAVNTAASGALGMVGASGQSVQADARHLADKISSELGEFFKRQGWTSK